MKKVIEAEAFVKSVGETGTEIEFGNGTEGSLSGSVVSKEISGLNVGDKLTVTFLAANTESSGEEKPKLYTENGSTAVMMTSDGFVLSLSNLDDGVVSVQKTDGEITSVFFTLYDGSAEFEEVETQLKGLLSSGEIDEWEFDTFLSVLKETTEKGFDELEVAW